MRRPRSLRAPVFALSALMLAACGGTPQVVKDAAPSIRKTIGGQKAPDETRLPIIASEPIAPDPEKALENYRKLLELAPDADTRAEAQRRTADLQVQVDDVRGTTDDSEATLQKSIQTYQALLKERPADPNNDRVLYQMARAQQNIGATPEAIDTLGRLSKDYPDSTLGGDAHFRRAELLFRSGRHGEAEAEYAIVMDLGAKTSFYEPAQYKYGWSLYKQQKYPEAIASFFQILDRELPAGEPSDTKAALEGIAKGKGDLAKDSLRVVSLSFAALGGGKSVNEYLAAKSDPRFYPLLYNALGELLLEKRRYTDAAEAYAAFTERYAVHRLAPGFQSRVIATYRDGGFNDLVVREKERYAVTYDPAAAYWASKPPTVEVMTELRTHLEDLAKHFHAKAQQTKPAASPDYLVAARWYKRIIELYPRDARIAEINYLLADALFDGGKTREAAQEYANTAYNYAPHPRAGEAALVSFTSYEKYAKEVPPAERPAALRLAIDAGLKLADTYTQHSEKLTVLTQAAQDLYEIKALDEAITVAARVIRSDKPAPENLRRTAWSVTGDAQFQLQRYPEAETAFAEELKLTPANAPGRQDVIEQLAASIYKQAEGARDQGDLRAAVNNFLRVGSVTPTSKIRANADYDAAASLITLEDWPAAAQVLEGFRGRFPGHALEADVDKKLAVAYQKDNKPAAAAGAYARIAQRASETAEVRREAGWLSATLYDEAKQPVESAKAWQFYVGAFPSPLDRAMTGRSRLVELAKARGDAAGQQSWLRAIVTADAAAGRERTDATRTLAAQASLELGRIAAADAKKLKLTLPIEKSLPQKKAAVDAAVQALNQAASYGFAKTTTAATYELGVLYQDFGKSLIDSERPKKLAALELEQYNLLLEEQAFPFEEKAMQTHETNLRRISQGVYDEWVAKSAEALAKMAPGKYAKREQGDEIYESLR